VAGGWGKRTAAHDTGRQIKNKIKATHLPTYLPSFEIFKAFRFIFEDIFIVFLSSSCRETAKKAIKNYGKKTTGIKFFSPQPFCKKFLSYFFKICFVVFLNSPC
jgi:hypothetical protein